MHAKSQTKQNKNNPPPATNHKKSGSDHLPKSGYITVFKSPFDLRRNVIGCVGVGGTLVDQGEGGSQDQLLT